MKKVNLSSSEINQISMALFYYRTYLGKLSSSWSFTDSLIEKFNALNH